MTHASLFSGIGGFDLAAEWAGWTNVFNCEIDPFCRRVLAYHFPNAIQYEDIKTTDFRTFRGGVDVLTGGFPCQPFSLAGKRKGTDDNRYLWPEMLRAICELVPRWVVGENVFGIVNWSDGLVFEQVCADLENEGYEVQPYLIPDCAVDAPHQRNRVWFVAHRRAASDGSNAGSKVLQREGAISFLPDSAITNALCERSDKGSKEVQPQEPKRESIDSDGCQQDVAWQIPNWDRFPTQPPVCGRDDGLSARLDACPIPGWKQPNGRWRMSGYWRRESIKAYGNAVVPQVVLKIFETINQYETIYNTRADRHAD